MRRKHVLTKRTIWFVGLTMLFFAGCVPMYFPSSKVTVHDVFGNPVANVPIVTGDVVAEYVQMEGGFSPQFSGVSRLITNEHGECEIPGRMRFAMPYANAVSITINQSRPGVQKINLYDTAGIAIDKGHDLHVVLSPLDIDYHLCSSTKKELNRVSCLQYSSFFSAIREGDATICDNYKVPAIRDKRNYLDDTSGVQKYDQYISFRNRRDACITMVALRTNNKNLCDKLELDRDYEIGDLADKKRKCLAEFSESDTSGMIGKSNEEFRGYICSGHDWTHRDYRYRSYMGTALDGGIVLYRTTCKEPITERKN